jgi:hypothetical protein
LTAEPIACPMSALALPCGVSTPIVKTPSSALTAGATEVTGALGGGAATSELQPTKAVINPSAARGTAFVDDDRRMAGL